MMRSVTFAWHLHPVVTPSPPDSSGYWLYRCSCPGHTRLRPKRSGRRSFAVEVTFIVTVGMDACHLGKYILANNRFIGGNHDARVGLHHAAYVVQAAFVNVGNGIEVVFQDSLHTGKRSIAGAFARPLMVVYGPLQPLSTAASTLLTARS